MAESDTGNEFQVIAAGHICLDIIPDLKHLTGQPADFFNPGKLVETGPLALCPGGAVSNTGLALLKLGIPTALMGKIGDDACGLLLKSLLEKQGAGAGLIVMPGAVTSSTVIISPGQHDRMFLHNPAANRTFAAADIRYDLAARARLFHLGYPPVLERLCADTGRELTTIFRRIKELGLTTSLDMTMPDPTAAGGRIDWESVLAQVMPYVDIFLPSAAEILYMLDRSLYEYYQSRRPDDLPQLITGADAGRISSRLLGMGGAVVGIKCGLRGFYLHTAGKARLERAGLPDPAASGQWADREFWLPAYKAACYAGATGAGDAAIAGFLAAWLRGHDAAACVRYAAAAGASSVTAPDSHSGLLAWEAAAAALRAGWEQHPLTVAGAGWVRQQDGMWLGPGNRL